MRKQLKIASFTLGFQKYLPFIAILIAIVYLFSHFNLRPLFGDEGVLAMDAWRITRGEIPQKDFFQFIPPLAAYIQAFFFYITGPTVLSLRLLAAIYGIVLIALVWLNARSYLRDPLFLALPLALLAPFGVGIWPIASHHWLADILLLAGMPILAKAFKENTFFHSFLGGLLLLSAALTLQDQGAYAIIGVGIAVFAEPVHKRIKMFMGLMTGMLALGLAVLIPLAVKAGLKPLFKDWVLFPLCQYHTIGGNKVTIQSAFSQVVSQWNLQSIKAAPLYSLTYGFSSLFVYLLPFLCLIALILAWKLKWLPKDSAWLLTALSAAFLLAASHRWSLVNLVWAAPVPTIAVAMMLERFSLSKRKVLSIFSRSLVILLILSFLLFSLARTAMIRKEGNLHTVRTPAGSYQTFNPVEAREFQELVDAVIVNVPVDSPLFCYGFNPLPGFLTQHPNPTRFNFMISGSYYSQEQLHEWISSLETKKVVWGISDRSCVDDKNIRRLMRDYEPVFANGSFVLWKKLSHE